MMVSIETSINSYKIVTLYLDLSALSVKIGLTLKKNKMFYYGNIYIYFIMYT